MFTFLKKLFTPETEKHEVSLNQLSQWISENTKIISDEAQTAIQQYSNDIKSLFIELKKDIAVLGNATVKDSEKIQDRIKQTVLGHRAQYVKVLFQLIDSISIPEQYSYQDSLNLSQNITDQLAKLGKTTTKSYYAVQHLFHSELEPITKRLKQLDNLANQIKQTIGKNKLMQIEEIKQDINNIVASIENKKRLEQELKEQHSLFEQLRNRKDELRHAKESLNTSDEFLELEQHKKKLQEINESLKQKENKAVQLFSPLETALKKYKRITLEHEGLLGEYTDSAMHALMRDKELHIIPLLQKIKETIRTLGLKDQKQKRTLETIELITPELLQSLAASWGQLFDQKEELEKDIHESPVPSKIKEAQYKLEKKQAESESVQREIDETRKKFQQIQIISLKTRLQDKIKEVIAKQVTII